MKKKIFNVFLTILTVITQINFPTNALAEDTAGVDGDDSGISVSVDENQTSEENTSDEANQSEEGETVTSEDPFTFEISYDDEFSKATITVSYGKDDASYLDLDNGEEFQELADQDVIAVNDEKTSDLSLAFDVTANGDYKMSVSAYDDNDEVVASSEKIVQVSDIKDIEEVTPTVDDEKVEAAKETIAEASINDIRGYIDSGKTFAFFVGNKADDELWQRVLAAYSNIQTNLSGEYDTTFFELQGEGDFSKIANVINDAEDISALTAAYEDLTSGSTGHGAVGFVFNKRVIFSVVEHEDTDEYTVQQQAMINYLSKYMQPTSDNTVSNTQDGIMLASTGSTYTVKRIIDTYVGDNSGYIYDSNYNEIGWKYDANGDRNEAQTFTAPESGTYFITLWGATGDSDSGSIVDSFLGDYGTPNKYIGDDGQWHGHTSGIGGEAGKVTGYVHLEKGQTIYLSLGLVNGMTPVSKYGGGGAGDGVEKGFLAGGGGLGAIYTTLKGNGELTNYSEGDSSILMVAGGGGGAEDFYTASWDYNDYYCSYNKCRNVYGGNGGKNPTTGVVPAENNAANAVAESGAYKFGLGQAYAAYHNASSGGGGAGYYGGKSAATPSGKSNDYGTGNGHTVQLQNSLRGGTGAGGSSYINESVVSEGTYIDGDNSIYGTGDHSIWPTSHNAGATIQVVNYDEHVLTINYIDVNSSNYNVCHKIGTDDSPNLVKVAESVTKTYTTGTSYEVVSPTIDGYTLVDANDDSVVTGTMPDSDVTVNVYYNYPQLTINYLKWDSVNGQATETKLADSYTKRMQKGTAYSVDSPSINGYALYYKDSTAGVSTPVAGTMPGVDTVVNVYYVEDFNYQKHIIAVNGISVDRATSDAGLGLKNGDEVTFQIVYNNNQYEAVSKTITDTLPSGMTYSDGGISKTWNVTAKGAKSNSGKTTSDAITFSVKVTNAVKDNDSTVQNWGRPDSVYEYNVTKSADPATGSDQNNATVVTTNDFITYTLKVTNTGSNPVKNIVVVDSIPNYTTYAEIDNDSAVKYNGIYVADGNYVKYVIDELAAGGTAYLKFKVRVTGEGTTNTKYITNIAKYQNFPTKQSKDDASNAETVINSGIESNKTVHKLIGAKIEATKTSTPASGSIVSAGQTIHYKVDLFNSGEVRANYVRMTDDIPVGTTYVNGSLKLSGDTGSYTQDEVWSRFGYNGGVAVSTQTSTKTVHHDAVWSGVQSKSRWQPYSGTMIPGGEANGLMQSSYQLVGTDEVLVSWSAYMSVGNCGGDIDSHYGNYNYHYKEISIWISYDGSNYQQAKSTRVYTKDGGSSISTDSSSYGTSVKYVKLMGYQPGTGGYCWNSVDGYVDVQYKKMTQAAYDEQVTEITGYSISTANINVSGGTVKSVVIKSNNTNWNYSGVDTSKFNISVNGGTLTLTPKTTGSVGNVSSTDINNALKAIKWTGTTAPNPTVTVNGSDVMTGYSDSTNSCRYVTNNGTPYVECIGVDVDKNDHMYVEFDVTVNSGLASTFEIKNVAKYETYQSGTSSAGTKATKPTDTTNETVHYLQDQVLKVVASKSSNPTSGEAVSKGREITYSLTFTNKGNTTIKYLQVRDAIPSYTSFNGYASDGGVYSQNGNYVEWVLTDIKVDESKTVSFTVKVNNNITTSDKIVNVAYYEIHQENPGDAGTISTAPTKPTNETVHTYKVKENEPSPVSVVSKSSNPVSGSTVHRQDEIEYVLTVENTGSNVQDFVLVEDKIPDGTTYNRFNNYTGGSKSGDDLNIRSYYDANEKSVKYIVSNLASGDSVDLRFVVKVNKEIQLTEIRNIAKYLGLTAVNNTNTDEINARKLNDSDTVNFQTLDNPINKKAITTNQTVHYLYQPSITVTKDSDPESNTVVARGSQITYTLTVTNTGDDVANYVNVADVIPANTTYVNNSAKTSVGTDASSVKKTNGSISEVQYVLYDLQPNETRTVSFTVEVNKNTQSGAFIANVAVYDNFEIDHGKPGKDDFVEPSKPTNETIHTVEMSSDIIMTGGEGWDTYLPYIGGGLIAVALIVIVITSKKKKTK